MIFSNPEIFLENYWFETMLSKADLLGHIVDVIYNCGYKVTTLAPKGFFPFRLQIDSKSNTYKVHVYIWQLSKKIHNRNEFEIQVTGTDHFILTPGEKTLLLGWWKEANIFVGFDVRKHLGKLHPSYLLKIQETILRKAYLNEFHLHCEENGETIVAFTPEIFAYYVNNLESLHNFSRPALDLAAIEKIVQVAQINHVVFTKQDRSDSELEDDFMSLSSFLSDVSFKKRVLNVYGYRCAFCGSLNSVEAVHIIPVNHENSTDETRNGLALCGLHHKAYDQALVTVAEDYSVVLNRYQAEELKKLKLEGGLAKFAKDLRPIILLPPAISDRPHVE